MLIAGSPSTLFCLSFSSPVPDTFEKSSAVKNILHCLYPFAPQAITAISAPGETTALWTKFGEKIAPRVASENATKQE